LNESRRAAAGHRHAGALKPRFLAAKVDRISRGPSGVHLLGAMSKLGIAEEVKANMVQPDLGVRVGTLVADGKAEIGVQQIGELLPIPGIAYIGPMPAELQTVIIYGMGRSANARQWDAASALGEVSHLARRRADAEKARARSGGSLGLCQLYRASRGDVIAQTSSV